MNRNKYTEQQHKDVLRLRQDGIPLSKIKELTGVTYGAIQLWCKNADIKLTSKQRGNNNPHKKIYTYKNEVIELSKNGVSLKELSERFGLSPTVIKRYRREEGLTASKEVIGKNISKSKGSLVNATKIKFLDVLKNNGGILISEYINGSTKVVINCDNGHVIQTTPRHIINGTWCGNCAKQSMIGVKSPYAQKWLKVNGYNNHGEYYNEIAKERGWRYLSTIPVTIHENSLWQCEKDHIWLASADNITKRSGGTGCPFCVGKISEMHQQIVDYIKLIIPEEPVQINDRSLLKKDIINRQEYKKPLEIDILIPSRKLAIEFNGLYWHSDGAPGEFKSGKEMVKAMTCHKLGYQYLMIYEDEWSNKKELVKAMICQRLGVFNGTKLFARKLELRYLGKNRDWEEFFDRNHLDGNARASWAYGLFLGDKMVMCASVRKNFKKEMELARLATDYDYLVVGGASRLIKAIKAKLADTQLVSYSNNRLSSGNLYKSLGFTEITETVKPGYFYTDCFTRLWRFKCKRINDPVILAQYPTEKAQALGGVFSKMYLGHDRPLYKIEDAGHRKWAL